MRAASYLDFCICSKHVFVFLFVVGMLFWLVMPPAGYFSLREEK
jgi:hypothetical protein